MKILTIVCGLLCAGVAHAQDSLKTTYLQEVVTTGTKFEVPVEKSGKTIYKLTDEDLRRNAGKSAADILNDVPGIQTDGNFGAPGTNVSYFVRGARSKQTLILIDGVPLNDPSSVNAEFDLRYLPVSQVESIEVLKGGLSTLYGTGAAAGVINIRLKNPGTKPLSGTLDVSAASYGTYAQNVRVGGSKSDWSYMVMANNVQSEGFSSALDTDPNSTFDKDGFSRQNVLVKTGYRFNPAFTINVFGAYEKFKADYDDYEFTDAPNVQRFEQHRVGLNPIWIYNKGELEARVVYNANERAFESSFPAEYEAGNLQAEVIQRHRFSNSIQGLFGLNYQHMDFDEKGAVLGDTARMTMFDPYVSLLADLPSGLSLHAGIRLNTHSIYGSKVLYNINPSFLFNQQGSWAYKVIASLSSSYITPSVYQLYSIYGNKDLLPEEALNVEAGLSVYGGERWNFNVVWFRRNESQPVDFVSQFDNEGNYLGGKYENLTTERTVNGIEISARFKTSDLFSASVNYTHNDTDKPESFYRIPKDKWGAELSVRPLKEASLAVKYTYTGDRVIFDFSSFSEVLLANYQLVDVFASYGFMEKRLTVYGAVNNAFDAQFIGVLGYTTRGRNYGLGLRYNF
jgi:vitamin B12 transporter